MEMSSSSPSRFSFMSLGVESKPDGGGGGGVGASGDGPPAVGHLSCGGGAAAHVSRRFRPDGPAILELGARRGVGGRRREGGGWGGGGVTEGACPIPICALKTIEGSPEGDSVACRAGSNGGL